MQSVGSTKPSRYAFWDNVVFFLTIVIALGVIVYAAGFLLHVSVKHTYFDPASPIGVLVSDRYTTIAWWALALSTLQLLIPAMVYMVWIDRWLKNYTWAVLWIIVIALLVAIQFIIVIYFAKSAVNCNAQGETGNLCNALLRCCVPDIYLNPLNQCPPGPCGVAVPAVPIPTTIDDLSANGMFILMLWFNVAFFVMSLLILLILVGTLVYGGRWSILSKIRRKKRSSPIVGEDEEEEEEDVDEVNSKIFTKTGTATVFRRNKPPPRRSEVGTLITMEPVTTVVSTKMSSKDE